MTKRYLCPRAEVMGYLPGRSVARSSLSWAGVVESAMVSVGMALTRMLCVRSCLGANGGAAGVVVLVPCLILCMCPSAVSIFGERYFWTLSAVRPGHPM